MLKVNLNKTEIDKIIENNGIYSSSGEFGTVLPYENGLGLKFSSGLVGMKGFNRDFFEENKKELYVFEGQIAKLADKQNKIKLTSLPMGVAYFENVPIAIILKYFDKHKNLLGLKVEHHTVVVSIFLKLLDILDELMNNGIYQLDIKEDNFIYSTINYKAEAIDLDGPLVKIGRENIQLEEMIYRNFIAMVLYLAKSKLAYSLANDLLDEDDYKRRIKYLESLRTCIHGFNITQILLNDIKNTSILDHSKKNIKIKNF